MREDKFFEINQKFISIFKKCNYKTNIFKKGAVFKRNIGLLKQVYLYKNLDSYDYILKLKIVHSIIRVQFHDLIMIL